MRPKEALVCGKKNKIFPEKKSQIDRFSDNKMAPQDKTLYRWGYLKKLRG